MSSLEGRVHHIDYMFIHLSCMHQVESMVPQISFVTPDWKKMMGNEERGQSEAHCQKEMESIDGEVARLTSIWTSVEHQMEGLEQVLSIKWNGNVRTVFYGNTACIRPIEAAPLLFSHEQQQQCLRSSTNDNLVHWSSLKSPPLWAQFQFSSTGCYEDRRKHWTSNGYGKDWRFYHEFKNTKERWIKRWLWRWETMWYS
jgi:hypothetical protein